MANRNRIVSAARVHFFAHGFRTVTMDDLAAELGLSKKTLYAHFPSKDALLEAVLRDKFARVDTALTQCRRAQRDSFAALLGEMLIVMQRELDEIKPPFIRDMRRATEVFQRLQERRAELIRLHFGRLFREGQRQRRVRRDIPAKLMIETLLSTVGTIMNPQKIEELRMPPKEVFAGTIGLLLHGAILRTGSKR